jgi:hypothetical protein
MLCGTNILKVEVHEMVSDKFEEENKTKKQVYNKVVNNTL